MSVTEEILIKEVILVEGGYVNNPNDSGGATKYGITQALAREYGYRGDMKDLTEAYATDIYIKEFCRPLMINEILSISLPLAREILDTAVNCGVKASGKILQRALNALNFYNSGDLYPDLLVDGSIGAKTITSLKMYLAKYENKKGLEALLKALNCLQGARYIEIVEAREKDKEFLRGWLINRVNVERL